MTYKQFEQAKANPSPYAHEAVCYKCKYCHRIRQRAFCSGYGKTERLPWKTYDTDKKGYCARYYPKGSEDTNENHLAF